MDKKILLTGGHAGSTAYAVVEEIKNRNIPWNIYFIGSSSAVEGRLVPTYEQTVLPKLGVEFFPITAGRVQRKFTIWTIPSLIKIPIGFFNAFYLVSKINPDIVLSFGGFIAFPVVVAAKLLGKKVIIHEQTAAAGLANRYSFYFADKVAISRDQSKTYFPADKVVITGNPVSREVLSIKPKEKIGKPPTIFVTGGSRGSEMLNSLVSYTLTELLSKYKIIHQTGQVQLEELSNIKQKLSPDLQEKYVIYGLMTPSEWKETLIKSDVVVTRAGANIASELMVVKTPSIFVPIPFSQLDEQTKNAQVVKEFGSGRIIKQKDLTSDLLLHEIEDVVRNWAEIVNSVKDKQSPDLNASSEIVDLLEKYIS